jgi:hypothetical protein
MTGHHADRAMACLSAIRKGRAWLDAKILEHMGGLSATEEKAVRGEYAYNIAEFFYVAGELGLLHRERLKQLIARHNADMKELLRDPRRAWSMGLSPQRVGEAIFSPDQQTKIFQDQGVEGQEVLHLDLSDMSKLLAPLMSEESCRKILRYMAKAGLLKTRGKGRVFVSSPGLLEEYFREHLLIIDHAMRGQ